MAVVVLDELAQHALQVSAVGDQQPVKALPSDGADESLSDGVAFGALTGVRITRMPSALNTASKTRVNLPSLSRIRNSRGLSRSGSENTKFLACWVVHAPSGFSVRPARCTRRVESSMKNSA
jgi:hypothetical protein